MPGRQPNCKGAGQRDKGWAAELSHAPLSLHDWAILLICSRRPEVYAYYCIILGTSVPPSYVFQCLSIFRPSGLIRFIVSIITDIILMPFVKFEKILKHLMSKLAQFMKKTLTSERYWTSKDHGSSISVWFNFYLLIYHFSIKNKTGLGWFWNSIDKPV